MDMASSDRAIDVRRLRKVYRHRPVVRRLSFSVRRGEIFGLLGPNGAGKTTLLSMLSTLVRPDEGRITILGLDLAQHRRKVKGLLGVVPQELALYERLSARQNLLFFGRLYGVGGRELRRRCDEILDVIELRDRARDPVTTFSGGMKRRLNVGVALVHRPQVLFLDEPTVGLDPHSRNFIFDFIARLRANQTTIIYTTHYMEEAERLCDRLAIIDEGRILAVASPDELISHHGQGVIRLKLDDRGAARTAAWADLLPSVTDCCVGEEQCTLRTSDAHTALAELMQVSRRLDIGIQSLQVMAPNLETVFLQLTGRHLRD
jgi:ABC-2 type transport system ATP-binding protein